MSRRIAAAEIAARKGAAFPVITAYDAPFARCAEAAGIDVVLVGDSLGMVVLGYESTASVELADMIRHGAAAARGAQPRTSSSTCRSARTKPPTSSPWRARARW